MQHKGFELILAGVLMILLISPSYVILETTNSLNNSYYSPVTISPVASILNLNQIYLPIILKAPDRYYAQVEKSGVYYGIWATIETPNPAIREPYFSYASINIISPDGKWIEVGVNKGIYTDCVPRFSYAIQPGFPVIVISPVPIVGVAYQYMIEKISNGVWLLRVMQTNGSVIYSSEIENPGMNYGNKIQAVGEVNSPSMINDMGIAGLLSLKWRMLNGNWSYWNGWTKGVENNPPYQIVGIPPDTSNNVQISGNNGKPIPPDAPCP